MIKNIQIDNYTYCDSDIKISISGKITDTNAFIKDLCDLVKKYESEKK